MGQIIPPLVELKNQAKVLLENLLSLRKSLTSFHWRMFLPVKAWRPRLPFEKYRDFIKMQGELSRELQRKCHSEALKLSEVEKECALMLKEYAYALELAFKGTEVLREQRELRDEGEPAFKLKNFKRALEQNQQDMNRLFVEAKKLNEIWISLPDEARSKKIAH